MRAAPHASSWRQPRPQNGARSTPSPPRSWRARESGVEVVEPDVFASTPGRGIRAVVGAETILVGNAAVFDEHGIGGFDAVVPDGSATDVFVVRGGRALGAIRIADTLRPEAVAAVAGLRALGPRCVLLTGDAAAVAAAVARSLGVDEFSGDLLPEQKRGFVAALVERGRTVAMVGVAMGSGTDVARESADIVLLGNDLSRFVETIRIARRTRHIVLENFAGMVAFDAVGIALAAVGPLDPLLAAFIHVASELAFILNATRMLPRGAVRVRAERPTASRRYDPRAA